jgi:ribosomal protein S2
LKFYNLGYNSLLPSYVFASNIKQTSSCIFEAISLNIPCSTLLDSNIGYYGIFYGIPSNDDNFVSIYLFTRLFVKIYLKSIYDNIKNLKLLKRKKKI